MTRSAALQGRDRGELKLSVIYVPLTRSNPMVGDYGAVFVFVRKGRDFPRMIADAEDSCNPYFQAKVGDQTEAAQPVKNTCVRLRRSALPLASALNARTAS